MLEILNNNIPNEIVFFIGDNGCGKSNALLSLAYEAIHNQKHVIAISNTIHNKFRNMNLQNKGVIDFLHRRLPPEQLLAKIILARGKKLQDTTLERIGSILNYMGFSDEIGISINNSSTFYYKTKSHYIFEKQPNGIIWLKLRGNGYDRSSLNILEFLKKEDFSIERKVNLFLKKGSFYFNLKDASSGEVTLLSIYAFIAENIKINSLILIDEPENSLHPQWQRDYCSNLMSFFSLFGVKIFIATHSPIIVSGSQANGIPSKILEINDSTVKRTLEIARSIEEILCENFKTIPPANHFLSEQVADLLHKLNIGEIGIKYFNERISNFLERSYDDRQKNFLQEVIKIGTDIYQKNML